MEVVAAGLGGLLIITQGYAVQEIVAPGGGGGGAGGLEVTAGETETLLAGTGRPRTATVYAVGEASFALLVQVFNSADGLWTTQHVETAAARSVSDATQTDTDDADTYCASLQDFSLPSAARILIKNLAASIQAILVDVQIADTADYSA